MTSNACKSTHERHRPHFLIQSSLPILIFLSMLSFCFHGQALAQAKIIKASIPDQARLEEAFKGKFLIGAALNEAQFSGEDERGAALVRIHFNSITPKNILTWESVHPRFDTYSFSGSDKYVTFGELNRMVVIGQTLVWHNQTPKWVFENYELSNDSKPSEKWTDRETLLKRMRDHIITVVGRYKGRIKGWDVVNEALNEDGTLRQTQWMKIIGEEYILKAYQFANEADPGAELYYNDFSLENTQKREGALVLIKKLQSQGVHIAAVGLQGHYKMDWPRSGQLDSTIKAFAAIGIKVNITELDIDVLPSNQLNAGEGLALNEQQQSSSNVFVNGLPDSVEQVLAKRYADLFTVFVKHANVIDRVTFWGVTDGDSWLNSRGCVNYPLLFDRAWSPKPALNAVIKATF